MYFSTFLQKEVVVPFLKKDGSLIIATVVDVVEAAFSKLHSSKIVKVSKKGV